MPSSATVVGSDTTVVPNITLHIVEETGIESKEVLIITLQHHENDDGSGYPYDLKKDEIHICCKIARMIDVYGALTANRAYGDEVRDD